LFLTNIFLLPQIEKISQRPAIEFLKEKATENCYIWPIGYKSYAHYFYADMQPTLASDGISKFKSDALDTLLEQKSVDALSNSERGQINSQTQNWLLTGEIDKPAYFLVKVHRYEASKFPTTTFLKQVGGFVFLERLPE